MGPNATGLARRRAAQSAREDQVTGKERNAGPMRTGRMDRRTFLKLVGLAGGVALASACAPTGGPPQGTSGQKPSAPAAGPTTAPAATSAPVAKPTEAAKPAAEAKPAASPQAAPAAASKVSEIVSGWSTR
jgi:hypothetical protein